MQFRRRPRVTGLVLILLLLPAVVAVALTRNSQEPFSPVSFQYTAGLGQVGSAVDSGNQAGMSATQVVAGRTGGALRNISVYVQKVQPAPRNHMQVAIYLDNGAGAPGQLLAPSRSQALRSNSWNKFPMPGIKINPRVAYWLAFNVDGGSTQYRLSYRAGKVAWKIPTPFGTWPGLFGAPTQPMGAGRYSIYMTYGATRGGVEPEPTPVAINTPPAEPDPVTPTPTAPPVSPPASTPSGAPPTPTPPSPAPPPPSSAPPPAPATRGCPLPDHPKPSCTGIPPGTHLTDVALNEDNDAYRVTTDGTVLDGVHVPGIVIISANNVTVRNSLIDGSIINEPQNGVVYKNLIVSDTTIGPTAGCFTKLAGVSETNYTAIRVLVQHHEDGFWIAGPGNVTVRDSYEKGCALPDGSSHSDGIQAVCFIYPCTGLVFDHNTIDLIGVDATFPIHNGGPGTSTFTVTNNLVGGGAYTIVTQWKTGPNWQIKNNKVVNNAWAYGASSAENTCAHQDWSGNQIVEIDSDYNITSVVSDLPCVE